MTDDPGEPARRVKLSFVAMVAVAFLVLSTAFYDINQNRHAIHQLRALAAEQREFRVERAARTSATDTLICRQLEKVKTVIRGVVVPNRADLLRISYYREHPREVAVAIANGRKVATKFAPTNCTNLPTSSGGAFPKHQPKTR